MRTFIKSTQNPHTWVVSACGTFKMICIAPWWKYRRTVWHTLCGTTQWHPWWTSTPSTKHIALCIPYSKTIVRTVIQASTCMQTWNKHQYFSPKLPVKTVILSIWVMITHWSHFVNVDVRMKKEKKLGSYSCFSNRMWSSHGYRAARALSKKATSNYVQPEIIFAL